MTLTRSRYGVAGTLVRFSFILGAVVVAQGVLNRYFPVIRYFDLPLVFTIYYGFTLPNPLGVVAIGSVLGLLQDSLSGAALGTNGFSKTLIGFLAVSAGTRFDVDQPVTRILALLLFTLIDATVKLALETVSQPVGFSIGRISPMEWLLAVGFNLLFGMILFGYRGRSHNAGA
jgi:rod shape-determining protein MreD